MTDRLLAAVEARLALPPEEGPDKVLPLAEAVRRYVRPGMTLHLSTAHTRAHPGAYEVARQYWGRRAGFTLACLGLTGSWALFVHGRLAERLLTTFCGETYPDPAPSPLVNRAWREGEIQIQNWSILSYTLRLLAGAMGLPFLPTRSLLGSSMEEANQGDFFVAEDPFGEEGRIGLVRALVPDLSILHALAADRAGNTLLAAPAGEGALGALAARQGAIVTVERIVPTAVIRRHAHLARLPAQYVLAVAEAPLGGHPGGTYASGLPESEGYAEDYDFATMTRQAFTQPESAEAWVRDWVLDCPTPADYVARLGPERVRALRARARPEAWREELAALAGGLGWEAPATAAETMVVTASRRLAARVRDQGYNAFLAGVGASNLAAWLAAYRLKAEGVAVELMAEIGMAGYLPRGADPFIFSLRHLPTAKSLTDVHSVMGVFMGGRWNRCLGVLAAGQVDRAGNLNSTLIPGQRYLTGSGGANDVCSAAREVLVTLAQSRHRFVEKVPYITGPGRRVRTVVSDLGVFEKADPHGELTLTAYLPSAGPTPEAAVAAIRAACGWDLRVAPELAAVAPPTPDELVLLRGFDPRRQFLGGLGTSS